MLSELSSVLLKLPSQKRFVGSRCHVDLIGSGFILTVHGMPVTAAGGMPVVAACAAS